MARDPVRDAEWIEYMRRLDSGYMAGGTKALDKMTPIEVLALRNEKIHDLKDVLQQLEAKPDDALCRLNKERLVRDANDLANYLNARTRAHAAEPEKSRGIDR